METADTNAATAGPEAPRALEAERSILCSMLLDADAIDRAIEAFGMEGQDLFLEVHRRIYKAIVELVDKGQQPDLVILGEELKRRGQLDSVGGIEYLSSIYEYAATSANVPQHIALVREKGLLRRLIQAAHRIALEATQARDDASTILDNAEARIFEIGESRANTGFVSLHSLVMPSMNRLHEMMDNKEIVTGVPTGFTDLDDRTSGLQPSDLIVIAGRPGMGKTSFALNNAENAAVQFKKHVGVFSLEMSTDQLVQRLISSIGRVDLSRVRHGKLFPEQWKRLAWTVGPLSEAPIYIDDTPGLSVLDVRTRARRLKAELGLDLLIIDYLQLMSGSGKVENRNQEVSQITRSLKGLAKELNVPIVVLSQLSRATESTERRSKIPQLSDLRESGAIEQDADIVLFIYREELYKPEVEELKNKAQVIIAKHRNGPTGIVNLTFLKESTRFENFTDIAVEDIR